jgi:hypothetical protein
MIIKEHVTMFHPPFTKVSSPVEAQRHDGVSAIIALAKDRKRYLNL